VVSGKGKEGSGKGRERREKPAARSRPFKVALFPFATNAVGRIPALLMHVTRLFLLNALEKAAGLTALDLTPPPRDGEILSLTSTLNEDEVRETAQRLGADASIWGDVQFGPPGEVQIEEMAVNATFMLSAPRSAPETRGFRFDALRCDTGSLTVQVEVPALEDLVEEIVLAVADFLELDRDTLSLGRIGEGLTYSDRALTYFIYALRITPHRDAKLKLYRKAILADPHFALAHINAAQLLLGEGKCGEAMRLLLAAETHLKGSEAEPDILNLLGVSAMHMGMWEEAVKVWRRALSINPRHNETLCNLASAYAMRDMDDEAERLYARALQPGEEYPLACFSLGRLLAREGRFEEARKLMGRYIDLCPGDPWAYYILGTCLAGLGNENEARFALAKATQLDPDGEAGVLARRELEQLKGG